MSSPEPIRWGILATGWIAQTFAKDLVIDPHTRGVKDVKHTVTAAASSSSVERAQQFLSECKCPAEAKAYGSYEELVQDPNVDIIYVATPHSHHYQNAMLCLKAGKHVLCEKSFTVNAAQAKKLVEVAREKKLFLMEALWTRYFPLSIEIRGLIERGEIGPIHRVIADLSFGEDVEKKWGTTDRMVNMDLAGGALLDLGIYPLTWLFQCLYHTVPPERRRAPSVVSSIVKYEKTGADEMTSMILTFPSVYGGSHAAHGIALTNFRVATDIDGHNSTRPAIRIQGTKAEIQVDGPAYSPTRYRVIPAGTKDEPSRVKEVSHEIPPGWGMFWEADEAARCIRDGNLESASLGWDEILVIMETMDEVRKQNGLVYPDKIETTDYPVKL
ncbi:MAG: hypothetical protein M1825_005782 [Sarcosagium campestre]|nr:MAG: hypothetical protein M1825_005782 [Sarcosagium campestre]